MIRALDDCDNCIHKNVCSIKNEILEIKHKIRTALGPIDNKTINDKIKIEVKCSEYKIDTLFQKF